MPQEAVHQVVSTLEVEDAVGNEVRLIAERLRRRGFASDIFTVLQRGDEPAPVRDLSELLEERPPALVIYHFATASPATRRLVDAQLPLALVYHNVTPEHFFWGVDRDHFDACRGAAADLDRLRGHLRLTLCHSDHSRRDLATRGFAGAATFPLLIELSAFDVEAPQPDDGAAREPILLSVGRIVPNKCIEDSIRLLSALRRDAAPGARLWIVGDASRMPGYVDALRRLAERLGVTGAVEWLGRVGREELALRFRRAAILVSMSEHEGFGGPLVEAMRSGLPVLAYDAAAVGETLGGAGILLPDKREAVAAEAAAMLLGDPALRRRQIESGRRRAAELTPDAAFSVLMERLDTVLTSHHTLTPPTCSGC